MKLSSRARLLSALEGKPVDRPPVWLMRQAGRYLPGYQSIRQKHSFWELCHAPQLCTQAAMEPMQRFALDAAIVFSDILVIPQALGMHVNFDGNHGPKMTKPLKEAAELASWNVEKLLEALAFVPAAVRHLREALGEERGLLGFAGAPWTLLAYMLEGHADKNFAVARSMLHAQPEFAHKAMDMLADILMAYLEAQCEAGADAVQLFDSWGGLLNAEDYSRFALPPIQKVAKALTHKNRRLILFVRDGQHLLPLLADSGCQGISLDWRIPFEQAAAQLPNHCLQGNVDPALLLASPEVVRTETRKLLAAMKARGHFHRCIVNLGHGIFPQTQPECVRALCEEVALAA
ncbi:MAG: uroporphyrinogen decarboxylase [Cystobacterineae bacterium]|nr:uroporphyrinogen decarboxylase [Cystobacterineae bacterium]